MKKGYSEDYQAKEQMFYDHLNGITDHERIAELISLTKEKGLQRWAIEVSERKKEPLGKNICEFVILNSEAIDPELTMTVTNLIFDSEDARMCKCVSNDHLNDRFFYTILENPNIGLTTKQKELAVREAIRAMRFARKEKHPRFSKKECLGYDLRYLILKNPNWSDEEKELLIRAFYEDKTDLDFEIKKWRQNGRESEEDINFYGKVKRLYSIPTEEIPAFSLSNLRKVADQIKEASGNFSIDCKHEGMDSRKIEEYYTRKGVNVTNLIVLATAIKPEYAKLYSTALHGGRFALPNPEVSEKEKYLGTIFFYGNGIKSKWVGPLKVLSSDGAHRK